MTTFSIVLRLLPNLKGTINWGTFLRCGVIKFSLNKTLRSSLVNTGEKFLRAFLLLDIINCNKRPRHYNVMSPIIIKGNQVVYS